MVMTLFTQDIVVHFLYSSKKQFNDQKQISHYLSIIFSANTATKTNQIKNLLKRLLWRLFKIKIKFNLMQNQ